MIFRIIIRIIQALLYVRNTVDCIYHKYAQKLILSIRWKIDFIRNLYFCLKYLPYEQAIRVPIKVERNVRILQLRKGQIKIENIIGMYQIVIGLSSVDTFFPELPQTMLLIKEDGELVFKGRANIAKGAVLRIDENSKVIFGDDFFCNRNALIRSNNLISFGSQCRLGLDVTINTTDGHQIRKNDDCLSEPNKPIVLANNVWICTRCIIGKGTELAHHCIVAQGSIVVHKKVTTPYTLIHGAAAVENKGKYERLDF